MYQWISTSLLFLGEPSSRRRFECETFHGILDYFNFLYNGKIERCWLFITSDRFETHFDELEPWQTKHQLEVKSLCDIYQVSSRVESCRVVASHSSGEIRKSAWWMIFFVFLITDTKFARHYLQIKVECSRTPLRQQAVDGHPSRSH